MSGLADPFARDQALAELSGFRLEFHDALAARADALFELFELFELCDAMPCAEGPVKSLVELVLAAEHRRGHGGMYDAVDSGRASWTALLDALRPARPLAEDLRRPREKAPGRLTPARVRRGFRNIRTITAPPTRAPKPTSAGPGRPPGSRNRHPASLKNVGKTTKRDLAITEHRKQRAGRTKG